MGPPPLRHLRDLRARLLRGVGRLLGGRRVPVWYHEAYRLPVADIHEVAGIETRRADLALWALLGTANRRWLEVHEPPRIGYDDLVRVHGRLWLEALTRPASLAAVFGLDRREFPVDPVLQSYRLAVGGTVAATRHVLQHGGPAVNLFGGFHHAFPERGGGFCPLNDLAVAIAVAREDGFDGRVVILDLDAHPPDGTAACLRHDGRAWIGSISGSDWGPVEGAREIRLPDADDVTYLRALDELLGEAPRPDLVMVVAGGDVLAGDRFGRLRLTPDGVRARDERVASWIGDRPAVWVPGGGYHRNAWRLLAQTVGVLVGAPFRPVPPDLDPVASRFAYVSRGLDPAELRGEDPGEWISDDEIHALFGGPGGRTRLLGYYTAEGIEVALEAFGVLDHLRRLGYSGFRIDLDRSGTGDRARLTGWADGARHLLWEVVVSFETLGNDRLLFLQWMTMRHPLGRFERRGLPGQQVPGLGLAEEAVHLLLRVCERLDLAGILLRPAWFHSAWMSRKAFAFVDPVVQGQFEALIRDLGHVPLPDLSRLVAEGRVRCNGEPWTWPAEPMVCWRTPRPRTEEEEAALVAAREAARFTLAP